MTTEIEDLVALAMQNAESLELQLSRCAESERGKFSDAVGIALLDRYEQNGSINDLHRAITMEEHAIESIPKDHSDRPLYLHNLATALQTRSDVTGSMDDLNHAIENAQQAVDSMAHSRPECPCILNNLSNALQTRF